MKAYLLYFAFCTSGYAPKIGRRVKHSGRERVVSEELPAGTYKAVKVDGVNVSRDLPGLTQFDLIVEDGPEGQRGSLTASVGGASIPMAAMAELWWFPDRTVSRLTRFGRFMVWGERPQCFKFHPAYLTTYFTVSFYTALRLKRPTGKIYSQLIFCPTETSVMVGIGANKEKKYWLSCDFGIELSRPVRIPFSRASPPGASPFSSSGSGKRSAADAVLRGVPRKIPKTGERDAWATPSLDNVDFLDWLASDHDFDLLDAILNSSGVVPHPPSGVVTGSSTVAHPVDSTVEQGPGIPPAVDPIMSTDYRSQEGLLDNADLADWTAWPGTSPQDLADHILESSAGAVDSPVPDDAFPYTMTLPSNTLRQEVKISDHSKLDDWSDSPGSFDTSLVDSLLDLVGVDYPPTPNEVIP
ncbi:hypothetical protein FOZ63_002864 [Perkinsus olseni]|uniref:Uncharacterized protein n=1 Tax=Perkinsus olseni TaxID=32597 RepID=A0A7J6S403_PEROL|nr:hypothetical protein FOZ63_002864 [Perkinsus olseni]